jgi:predicted aspartyl protease
MPKFFLDHSKGILFCRASVRDKGLPVYLKLAIDTGASYTMISNEAILSIGPNPSLHALRKIEVTTGSGIIFVPVIKIPRFRALGYEIKNLEVICHTLPPESSVEGLLGLNFLRAFKITFDFPKNTIEVIK